MTSLFAILDHIRSRRGGPNLLFKFDFEILITFRYMAILVFCHFACKMPNYAHFLVNFGGCYPQNLTLIILTPKRHILGWKRIVWAINRENPFRGSTWARVRQKNQDPLEVGPLNPARRSEEHCKLPSGVWGPSRNWIWYILALKSDIWWQQF